MLISTNLIFGGSSLITMYIGHTLKDEDLLKEKTIRKYNLKHIDHHIINRLNSHLSAFARFATQSEQTSEQLT